MQKFYILLLFCGLSVALPAQQEEQYTQFMYYKLGLNPGYAGSQDGAVISLLARQQWAGLEGAPQTQLVTFNMPLFNRKVGVGGTIARHTIGFFERYTAEAIYAYRLRIGRGALAIGVQGSVRFLRANFNKAVATQPVSVDGAIPGDYQSKYVPNFGAGLYYSDHQFFLGISAPRLLTNNIDLADEEGVLSREVTHIYAMGGLVFGLSDKVKLQPQVLLKYVKGAPFDADANVNFIFNDRFTLGASYRLGGSKRSGIGESISGLAGFQINENLFFGVAYDATLSELRRYNSGTFEGVLRINVGGRSDEGGIIITPRFF